MHHSDRGSQPAAEPYRERLAGHGLRGSLGRRGNPYGNAEAESFVKTLRHEGVHPNGHETVADVVARLPRFTDEVDNAKRLHSALGYLSPVRFEEIHAREAAQSRIVPRPTSGGQSICRKVSRGVNEECVHAGRASLGATIMPVRQIIPKVC